LEQVLQTFSKLQKVEITIEIMINTFDDDENEYIRVKVIYDISQTFALQVSQNP